MAMLWRRGFMRKTPRQLPAAGGAIDYLAFGVGEGVRIDGGVVWWRCGLAPSTIR